MCVNPDYRGGIFAFATVDTKPGTVTHVAIADGSGGMISATGPDVVKKVEAVSNVMGNRYWGRRVITVASY